MRELALQHPAVAPFLAGQTVRKVIVVAGQDREYRGKLSGREKPLMRVLIASLDPAAGRLRLSADVRAGRAAASAIGPVQVDEIDGKAGHVLRTELDRILAVGERRLAADARWRSRLPSKSRRSASASTNRRRARSCG